MKSVCVDEACWMVVWNRIIYLCVWLINKCMRRTFSRHVVVAVMEVMFGVPGDEGDRRSIRDLRYTAKLKHHFTDSFNSFTLHMNGGCVCVYGYFLCFWDLLWPCSVAVCWGASTSLELLTSGPHLRGLGDLQHLHATLEGHTCWCNIKYSAFHCRFGLCL